jgi:hypothetical protein
MVYDDDTYEPPHHIIAKSDRVLARDKARIPEETQLRVADLMESEPNWTSEDIFDQMLDEGYEIELDEVHVVLEVIGRASR